MDPDSARALSVEFKVNLMEPAQGSRFQAVGRVLRAGRTLTVCAGEALAQPSARTIAVMQATMMCVLPTRD